MKTMYKNMLRSVIIYIVISVINFVIYALTFPETPLYERYPNIFYVGPILNIAISILGYSLAGRSMQTSGKKNKGSCVFKYSGSSRRCLFDYRYCLWCRYTLKWIYYILYDVKQYILWILFKSMYGIFCSGCLYHIIFAYSNYVSCIAASS